MAKKFTNDEYKDSEAVKKLEGSLLDASEDLDDYQLYQKKDYTESDYVKGLRDKVTSLKRPEWDGSSWDDTLNKTIDKILNREEFSYDLNGDALYQQYKDQFVNQGKTARDDAIGQAAAMTGGYGNSYAQSVGQQTFQGYMQQLNDQIPELYQLAYDQYRREGEDLYNQYGLLSDRENTEYGRYRDNVADFYSDRDYYTDVYGIEADREYGRFRDAESDKYDASKDTYGILADAYDRRNNAYWNTKNFDYGVHRDEVSDSFDESQIDNVDNDPDDHPTPVAFSGKSYPDAVKYLKLYAPQTVSGLRSQQDFLQEKRLSGGVVTIGGEKYTKYADYVKAYCEWAVS